MGKLKMCPVEVGGQTIEIPCRYQAEIDALAAQRAQEILPIYINCVSGDLSAPVEADAINQGCVLTSNNAMIKSHGLGMNEADFSQTSAGFRKYFGLDELGKPDPNQILRDDETGFRQKIMQEYLQTRLFEESTELLGGLIQEVNQSVEFDIPAPQRAKILRKFGLPQIPLFEDQLDSIILNAKGDLLKQDAILLGGPVTRAVLQTTVEYNVAKLATIYTNTGSGALLQPEIYPLGAEPTREEIKAAVSGLITEDMISLDEISARVGRGVSWRELGSVIAELLESDYYALTDISGPTSKRISQHSAIYRV